MRRDCSGSARKHNRKLDRLLVEPGLIDFANVTVSR
jgi:hypothetical protein